MHMSYLVNNHLNNLYVLSNKAIGPGKNPKLINVGPMSILEVSLEARVLDCFSCKLGQIFAQVKSIRT